MRAERKRETNIKAYGHARWRTAGQHAPSERNRPGGHTGDCPPV